jgi:sugar phosphate isomerase/epimerase
MRPVLLGKKPALFFLVLVLLSTPSIGQQYGLQLYSLRKQLAQDATATMAKVRDMGFRDIEMPGTFGLPFPELIRLLAANELNVVSFGADFETLAKNPQQVVDEARAYGAKFIVCSWIPHQNGSFGLADAEKAIAIFNNAAKIIASNGLLFCYQPHGYEFKSYGEETLFDYMMTKFDQRFVYLEMDVFWVKQAGQDPVSMLKKYPSRFVLLHLKDRKIGTANSTNGQTDVDSNVVLGTGDIGIAEIIKEAKRLGIRHYFIEDESPNAETQLPQSLAYLRSLQQ